MLSYMEKDRLEVGVDEAGRGPLFGAVYTAAVIFPQDEEFLNDLIVVIFLYFFLVFLQMSRVLPKLYLLSI